MATECDVQVTIEATNLKPEDNFVNRWHIDSVAFPDATVFDQVGDGLEAIYDGIAAWCSNTLLSGNLYLKWYDMADPMPRAPIFEETRVMGSLSSGASMPPEVATCISFEAEPVSGVNQARRRGRIYLPPLLTNRYNTDGSLTETTVNGIAATANGFLITSLAATGWKWSVASKVSGARAPVSRGWVDQQPDIQRRRGRELPYRLAFTGA